jgi:hypothetical protein
MRLCESYLSPDETTWAISEFIGSRPQKLLHNRLVQRIEELRTRLETATPPDVIVLQAGIREARVLLGMLHEHDPESVKKIYA